METSLHMLQAELCSRMRLPATDLSTNAVLDGHNSRGIQELDLSQQRDGNLSHNEPGISGEQAVCSGPTSQAIQTNRILLMSSTDTAAQQGSDTRVADPVVPEVDAQEPTHPGSHDDLVSISQAHAIKGLKSLARMVMYVTSFADSGKEQSAVRHANHPPRLFRHRWLLQVLKQCNPEVAA